MTDVFMKSPRKLRKEKRKREQQRQQDKQELEKLKKIYSSRSAKLQNMKKLEKNPAFQKKFNWMRNILTGKDDYSKIDPFKGLNDYAGKKREKKQPHEINFDDFFK